MNDRRDGSARYGNVGPDDPHADPATQPALLPGAGGIDRDDEERTVDLRVGAGPDTAADTRADTSGDTKALPRIEPRAHRTIVSGVYVGLVLAALVLVVLLVFILQNLVLVRVSFLGLSGEVPLGVALLLAAIAGVLLVAIPSSGRIMQLRRAAGRTRRAR